MGFQNSGPASAVTNNVVALLAHPRTAAQLAGTPSAADGAGNPGRLYYDPSASPTVYYTATPTAYVPTGSTTTSSSIDISADTIVGTASVRQVVTGTHWPSQVINAATSGLLGSCMVQVMQDTPWIRAIWCGAEQFDENTTNVTDCRYEFGVEDMTTGTLSLGVAADGVTTNVTVIKGTVGHAQYLQVAGPFKKGQWIKIWNYGLGGVPCAAAGIGDSNNVAGGAFGLWGDIINNQTGTANALSVMTDAQRAAVTSSLDPGTYSFRPLAILGFHSGPAVMGIGDSTGQPGQVDFRDEEFGVCGVGERCVGLQLPYMNLCASSETLAKWSNPDSSAAGGKTALRSSMAQYCTHGYNGLGKNDQGDDLPTWKAALTSFYNRTEFAAFQGWFSHTIGPTSVTTTDYFSSYANQTVSAANYAKSNIMNKYTLSLIGSVVNTYGAKMIRVFDVASMINPKEAPGKVFVPKSARTVTLNAITSGDTFVTVATDGSNGSFNADDDGKLIVIPNVPGTTNAGQTVTCCFMRYIHPWRVNLYRYDTNPSRFRARTFALTGALAAGQVAYVNATFSIPLYYAINGGGSDIHESCSLYRRINRRQSSEEAVSVTSNIGLPRLGGR